SNQCKYTLPRAVKSHRLAAFPFEDWSSPFDLLVFFDYRTPDALLARRISGRIRRRTTVMCE
ncbi:MAG: hypothetical protein LBU65_00815, partial [Planctomycetaceae bacterium]|nr:hypothetical protein [Planctomycetaceae bacterium]